jgi:hypothetical protein
LFSDYDLRGTFENVEGRMAKAVEQYPADRLLAQGDDELLAHFLKQFRFEVPTLTEGAISVDVEEAQVDVSGSFERDTMGYSEYYVPGTRVTYYVPFTGDQNLFKCRAGTFNFNPPRANIVGQELQFRYERADSEVGATKADFEAELRKVREWLGWTANEITMFNDALPPKIRVRIAERRGRLEKTRAGVQALGLPPRQQPRDVSIPAPTTAPRSAARPNAAATPNYDVALSFAGENRPYVHRVAEILKQAGVNPFYDEFEKAKLWGKNLVDYLADIYQHRSRFVVMFISKHYVEKAFPTHERQHAQARALVAKEEYILPARFDDTEVPGLAPTVGYADLRKLSPEQLAELILQKLGRKR